MNIDHKIRNLKYTISFEKGVELRTVPQCRYIVMEQDEFNEMLISGQQEDDIIYDKYVFNVNAPQFNSDIKITWKYEQ